MLNVQRRDGPRLRLRSNRLEMPGVQNRDGRRRRDGNAMTRKSYTAWICTPCAEDNGGRWPAGHEATFHQDICVWCGFTREVTEPRDWCWPDYKKGERQKQ